MDMPQVRLQSQQAKISLTITDAAVQIEQPEAEQSIRQPHAEITMHTTPSKLTIDQTQAWNDMDLKSVFKRTEDFAKLGKKSYLEGITRRVQEGKEMMEIENGGNPIANQARRIAERKLKDFAIGWIPSQFSVKSDYQPSELNINVKVNQPEIKNTPHKPQFEFQRGQVDTGIAQYQSLKVDFDNLKFYGVNGFEMNI
ncbi:hypothetical protein SAMN05421503_0869 [Terribacillus aidingensis]|uniref:Uncharacterized protein n=1 Tax=Terribacillus aidingensis TaxID=586416 RepID=A0A285N732_9BACI|nr:DUF6470 family protein [Terribacillus aidingensis]SNZ05138.1 hypothetical protein SAMN05421503_0869 [Terribacillus aidingensis]